MTVILYRPAAPGVTLPVARQALAANDDFFHDRPPGKAETLS